MSPDSPTRRVLPAGFGYDGERGACNISYGDSVPWGCFAMTQTSRNVLTAFDALSPVEQSQVAAEIWRRSATSLGLSEAALQKLANELFRA